jgi:rSAM/selenodomain-associated transferase 1
MNTLLVFLKAPTPGAVKTRLAAAIGSDEAASLYAEWTTRILRGLQQVRSMCRVIGYYAGDESDVRKRWGSFVDSWLPQPEGDLGNRLEHAFAFALADGPAAAIGTDCLDVDTAVVRSAFDSLKDADAALGPAKDGGYYLIGLRRMAEGVFRDIEWSSPRTLAQQRAALLKSGMTVSELPRLADIDTLEDWLAYQRERGE